MRGRFSTTAAMLVVAVLFLVFAVPAAAAPPNNPFVGSWETIYIDDSPVGERDIKYQIGGTGHFHGRTSATSICVNVFGEATPSSMFGWGTIISEDPYVFDVYVDIYCHTDEGRLLGFEGFHLAMEYNPVTDTLLALHYPPAAQFNCAWRTGADVSVCP